MTSAPVMDAAIGERAAAARVAELTPGQLECLHLVGRHMSSKEIALALAISPHTVDQRIRTALRVLRVERRSQAVRLLEDYGAETLAAVPHPSSHASFGPASQRPIAMSVWPSLPLPVATKSRPRNDMSINARLLWIVVIAMGSALSAGMYLAGLESLARLLRD